MLLRLLLMFCVLALAACQREQSPPGTHQADADASADQGDVAEDVPEVEDAPEDMPEDLAPDLSGLAPGEHLVQVTLDGEPVQGARVSQGGRPLHWVTDAQGRAVVQPDPDVEGQRYLIASHPEARMLGVGFEPEGQALLQIALTRYDASDNQSYAFPDPGEPSRSPTTAQCGHCHKTLNAAWFASPHRSAASNPWLHDLYEGAAQAHQTQEACEQAGGRWALGPVPGQGEQAQRCYLGQGVLPTLQPGCDQAPCEEVTQAGACADCHAPAIDGALGGRDLRQAQGLAFDYGVSCGVCHGVDQVHLDNPAPGVAGRLQITRPSERGSISLGAGGLRPLLFGPSHDSPNPRMGNVQRDHFREGTLCAGCHQYEQPSLLPGVSLDPERWPQGRLPVHSTWEEWRQGELSEATRCPSCHMPPEPGVANSADLQEFPNAEVGVQGGWLRPAGAVRQHSWLGPRQPQSQMLQLAASLRVTTKVIREGQLEVEITTTNSGAGHAIPTGEPLRSILLVVEAFCGEQPLAPVGGDVVPDFGGALAQKGAGEDWTRWPQAQPGDTLQAVRYADAWRDYDGVSPFQRGGLAPEHKGMRQEVWAGQATVASVEQGVVTLDGALPQADAVYLQRPALGTWAGSPGFGFARVMVGAQGERMVPHFRAVDVASDNRLMPGASFASRHLFEALCTDPVVRARLIHRAAPLSLALPRGWERRDSVMVEVER